MDGITAKKRVANPEEAARNMAGLSQEADKQHENLVRPEIYSYMVGITVLFRRIFQYSLLVCNTFAFLVLLIVF